MIDRRGVDADDSSALVHQPSRRIHAETGGEAEIFLAVGVFLVPAGIDENNVVRLNRGLGRFKIGGGPAS